MSDSKYDIFVSYSRKDIDFCNKLNHHLSSICGFSTFVDREGIEGGGDWAKEITDAVKSAEIFLLLLSSNSLKSENVEREICLAINSRRKIIPIRMENVIPDGAKEYQLATIQLVDIFDREHDEQLKIVERKITDRLGRKEALNSSEAQIIRETVEAINAEYRIREEMGTQILCQYNSMDSIRIWMPFSIGPFGGAVITAYDGKTLEANIDLNGKSSCDLKWLLYQLLDKGFPEKNGYKQHTGNPCYDVASFFKYTINDMPLAPKTSEQCLDDITRVCRVFYGRIVSSLGEWISYSRDFRLYIEELDNDFTNMFPESDGWVIKSKLSSHNGFRVSHMKTDLGLDWVGLINADELNNLLSIKIGCNNR